MLVDREDGAEEIDHIFLDCAFGGEETGEEDLGNSFGRPIHLPVGWPLLPVRFGVIHGRANQVERLQVIDAVLRVAVAVLEDRVSQCRVEVVSVDT